MWIQERTRDKTVLVRKVPGLENRADLMTKFLDGPRFFTLVGRLPLRILMRCISSEEASPKTAAVVATIALLPAAAADNCLAIVKDKEIKSHILEGDVGLPRCSS